MLHFRFQKGHLYLQIVQFCAHIGHSVEYLGEVQGFLHGAHGIQDEQNRDYADTAQQDARWKPLHIPDYGWVQYLCEQNG